MEPYAQHHHLDRMNKRPESHRLKSLMTIGKNSRSNSRERRNSLEKRIIEKQARARQIEAMMYSQRKIANGLKIKIKRAASTTGRKGNLSGSQPRYNTPGESSLSNEYGLPLHVPALRADIQSHIFDN